MMLMSTKPALYSVGTGASICPAGLNTQQGRWIKQPQANDCKEQFSTPPFLSDGLIPSGAPCFGGMGREPSGLTANPPLRLCSLRRCFAVARSTFVLESAPSATDAKSTFSMIYTFLIAPKGLKLSALNRVRMVSCYASNLNQARAAFTGLSLALVCRKPVKGGSRHA